MTPLGPDYIYRGFPGSIVVQNLPTSAGHMGSITGSERSPGEKNGNPPQYSSLGIPWTEKLGGPQRVGHEQIWPWYKMKQGKG